MISRYFRFAGLRFSALRFLGLLPALLLVAPLASAAPVKPAEASAKLPVLYDKQHDTLSLQAKDMSLRDILLQITRQTGMDVRIDPTVERKTTLNLKPLPLEKSVDTLLAGLNVLKEFKTTGKGDKQKDMLVGIVVLPEGKSDPSTALRLMERDAELAYRAGVISQFDKRAKAKGIEKDMMVERWKTRAGKLSAAEKARYDKLKKDADRRTAEQEAQRAEQEAKRKKREEERIERLKQVPGGEKRLAKKPDPEMAEKARKQFVQKPSAAIIPDPKD